MEKELVIGKNKTERKVRHIIKLVTAVGMWDSVPVGTLWGVTYNAKSAQDME